MILLVEAQSIWTLNILPRALQYLSESYNRYVQNTNQNIYGTMKVTLPRPELYVVYTGNDEIKKKTISLRKDFFKDNTYPIEIEIKAITIQNANTILKEYIEFTKILDKNNKKFGYSKKSITKTIDNCIKNDIMKDYLTKYEMEVYNIMTSIYSQEYATKMYGKEQYAAGIQQGIEQGMVKAFVNMIKDKIITVSDAAKRMGITRKEFSELAGLY